MDKGLVVPPEYRHALDQDIKFHFLDDAGIALNTLDRSDFNVIISNTQKIIKKRVHKRKKPDEQLFDDAAHDEGELLSNQRFEKLARLRQPGVYVDEAHHLFGSDLQKSMNSLRLTIDELAQALEAKGTRVVACYSYTGTPYLENSVLPEAVYSYGLRAAIRGRYLKDVNIKGYKNVKSAGFIEGVVMEFWQLYGGKLYEELPPKLAIFGATVNEAENEIRPAVEKTLAELGIPLDKALVNTGDGRITKDSDIKAFNDLDAEGKPYRDKSFHADKYCLDSRPGKECFLQHIFSDRVKEVYFTGMFTGKYNGLSIQYIDPETGAIRSYYPDFVTALDDGTIQVVEVKGDNKIDDAVVQAKAAAASEMVSISKMEYRMLAGVDVMGGFSPAPSDQPTDPSFSV